MKKTHETKEHRFKRLAEQRVNVILDKLRLLGQLSNRRNYDYLDTEVEAIFRAIQKDLNDIKAKFKDGPERRRRFRFKGD